MNLNTRLNSSNRTEIRRTIVEASQPHKRYEEAETQLQIMLLAILTDYAGADAYNAYLNGFPSHLQAKFQTFYLIDVPTYPEEPGADYATDWTIVVTDDMVFPVDEIYFEHLSDELKPRVSEAVAEATQAENELSVYRRHVSRLVSACKTFKQLAEVFPEAEKLVKDCNTKKLKTPPSEKLVEVAKYVRAGL